MTCPRSPRGACHARLVAQKLKQRQQRMSLGGTPRAARTPKQRKPTKEKSAGELQLQQQLKMMAAHMAKVPPPKR